jgi:triacylglycerol lipase
VLAYTGAPQVSIVSHSMGVTLARKVIKGGKTEDHTEGIYDVGPSLKNRVKAFVGIAGGNLGLVSCHGMAEIPTCSDVDGFNPGLIMTSGPSKYLSLLNKEGGTEASSVYVIWSKYDEVAMYECVVWGKITCRIPGQEAEVVKNSVEWTHIALRDKTGPDMIKWL